MSGSGRHYRQQKFIGFNISHGIMGLNYIMKGRILRWHFSHYHQLISYLQWQWLMTNQTQSHQRNLTPNLDSVPIPKQQILISKKKWSVFPSSSILEMFFWIKNTRPNLLILFLTIPWLIARNIAKHKENVSHRDHTTGRSTNHIIQILIYGNQEVFSLHDGDLGYCDQLIHTIPTSTDKPVYLPHRTIPRQLQGEVHKCHLALPRDHLTI